MRRRRKNEENEAGLARIGLALEEARVESQHRLEMLSKDVEANDRLPTVRDVRNGPERQAVGQLVVVLSGDRLLALVEQLDLVVEVPNMARFEEVLRLRQGNRRCLGLRRRLLRSNELLLLENVVGEQEHATQRLRLNRRGRRRRGWLTGERTVVGRRLDLPLDDEERLLTYDTRAQEAADRRGDLLAFVAADFEDQLARSGTDSVHLEERRSVESASAMRHSSN